MATINPTIMDNVIYPRSFWEALRLLPTDMQVHLVWSVFDYCYNGILPTDLNAIEQAIFISNKPYFDTRREKAIKNGLTNGRRGAPLGNLNASKAENNSGIEKTNKNNSKTNKTNKNNSKTNKTNKNNSKTNKNNSSDLFSIDTDTDNIDTDNIDTDADEDEDEDTDSTQGASSSSSSSALKDFSPTAFIKNWWNQVADQYEHLKKVEYISKTLEEKIVNGYIFAVECCDGNIEKAKMMMGQSVLNIAKSDFFKKNQGKATLTWLFASTDNLEKCANGQYNDTNEY